MQITLSFATTADGYLDDNSPRRLMISTPEDWEAVLRLRASHDAILAGAETLRRDDPALLLRDAAARELRRARGMRPDLTKVTLTHSGRLSPSMRFFTEGDADRYVFSEKELPELKGVAEVISSDSSITASAIVTELEKRGVERLLVEGGASVLRMFLAEGMGRHGAPGGQSAADAGTGAGRRAVPVRGPGGGRMPAGESGRHGGCDLHAFVPTPGTKTSAT